MTCIPWKFQYLHKSYLQWILNSLKLCSQQGSIYKDHKGMGLGCQELYFDPCAASHVSLSLQEVYGLNALAKCYS